MAGASASQLGITAPSGGFKDGGWYNGYNYDAASNSFGNAGQIYSKSLPQSGTMVSSAVNAQSAAAQGKSPDQFNQYLQTQQQNYSQATGAGGGTGGDSGTGGGAGGGTGGGTGGIGGAFGSTTPTLNLPDLYTSLSKGAGIDKMEADLTTSHDAYNGQISKINDNPFLSEADRTGRIAKLTTDYNNDVSSKQNALTMAKQDIQTQLDLQTKQFDINSQTATQALNEFNTMLQSGALTGATGNDIAAITKATGMSSSMIQAAVSAQTAKDTPTQIISFDDGTNQGFAIVNSRTGAVISKQTVAASKPSSGGSTGKLGSSEYNANLVATITPAILKTLNSYGNISPQDWQKAKAAWTSQGGSTTDFINNFGGYADTNRGDFLQAYGFSKPKAEK